MIDESMHLMDTIVYVDFDKDHELLEQSQLFDSRRLVSFADVSVICASSSSLKRSHFLILLFRSVLFVSVGFFLGILLDDQFVEYLSRANIERKVSHISKYGTVVD